jgi:hypothetical protein
MEAELKDVGDQALVRGLATAFPIVRPGLSYLTCGRRPGPATKRLTGHSLPLSRLLPCAGMFIAEAIRSGCVRFLATAHMKPTSSRAIAVRITVVLLPRPLSARFRAVKRV